MVGGETDNDSLQNSGIVGVLKSMGGSIADIFRGADHGTGVALEKILADPTFHEDKPDTSHPITFTAGEVLGIVYGTVISIGCVFGAVQGVRNRYKNYKNLATVPESLKSALNDVDELKKDLSATEVIREEESHYEPEKCGWACSYGVANLFFYTLPKTEKKIDKRAVTEPNYEKQKSAKEELKDMYDNSEFYSVRYAAGVALGKDKVGLTKTIVECRQVLQHKIVNQMALLDYKFEEIVQAAHDAAQLYRNLKSEKDDMDRTIVRGLLKECNDNCKVKDARIIAAKALGHSGLRIMASEAMYALPNIA